MVSKRIVLLAGKGASTNILFNAINREYHIDAVILEDKEDKKVFIRRRVKKLGLIKVTGQILFQTIITKLLSLGSKKRIQAIVQENNLDLKPIESKNLIFTKSINSDIVKDAIFNINPDLVIVNGTRIISKKILALIECPIINTHAGITPDYRGVHGAYWALVKNDISNCGVTVHLVDAGIDTGEILYQEAIEITKEDNFITYPYLQIAKGIPLLKKAIKDALSGELKTLKKQGHSQLWSHPTIWEYIYNRVRKNIK